MTDRAPNWPKYTGIPEKPAAVQSAGGEPDWGKYTGKESSSAERAKVERQLAEEIRREVGPIPANSVSPREVANFIREKIKSYEAKGYLAPTEALDLLRQPSADVYEVTVGTVRVETRNGEVVRWIPADEGGKVALADLASASSRSATLSPLPRNWSIRVVNKSGACRAPAGEYVPSTPVAIGGKGIDVETTSKPVMPAEGSHASQAKAAEDSAIRVLIL